MQSSSLLPASSVRSFRVRAPRPAPPLTLVAAIVLLMLGGLAGAVALDETAQPWIDRVVSSISGALPWNWPSAADDPFKGPIAMPVRVPLDPVPALESAPVAVAEAPSPGLRRDSDGGALQVGGATSVGAVSPPGVAEATGSGSAASATAAPTTTSAPAASPDAVTASPASASATTSDPSGASAIAPANGASASTATVLPAAGDSSGTLGAADGGAAASPSASAADAQ